MGLGGISIWQLIIVLVIVLLLFGTKKLKTLGGDLGSAIKGFRKAVKEENTEADKPGGKQHAAEEALENKNETVSQKTTNAVED